MFFPFWANSNGIFRMFVSEFFSWVWPVPDDVAADEEESEQEEQVYDLHS